MKDKIIILRKLNCDKDISQRELALESGFSLGKINGILNSLTKEGFLDGKRLTEKGRALLEEHKVDNAVIMAAGVSSRFVPLSYEKPKGLLEVKGEVMIERQIRQLIEAGITDISIVVGYMKEKFDYLIDKFGVKLIYNPDFAFKNNFSSLYHARKKLGNTYVLCSDHYIAKNIFNKYEPCAWYAAVYAGGETKEYCLKLGAGNLITNFTAGGEDSYVMYGPAFFDKNFSDKLIPLLEENMKSEAHSGWYWEDLYAKNIKNMDMYASVYDAGIIYEFENLEELRSFDDSYLSDSKSKIIDVIKSGFGINDTDIINIKPIKLGMTNSSFMFEIKGQKYICRIPGAGTDKFINRAAEYAAIEKIKKLNISDRIALFDKKSFIKVSEYEDGSRVINPADNSELARACEILRKLHNSDIVFDSKFDFEYEIKKYYGLCNEEAKGLFSDLDATMNNCLQLYKDYQKDGQENTPCHIDFVCDNLLVTKEDKMLLIDWEYASMSDPINDIAMFSIYSYFEEKQALNLLSIYLGREPSEAEKKRLFTFMSLGGMTWTLWCLYKLSLGKDFGAYTLEMYRYAKEYCKKSNNIK